MSDPDRTSPDRSTVALLQAVREIDRYAAQAGWDRRPRLFALVDTATLVAREPALAGVLGIDPSTAAPLTPVEQDELPTGPDLDSLLATVSWPEEVAGCALVVERVVLPPAAEAELPIGEDGEALAAAAAGHQERQDVRMVVAVLRSGSRECGLRLRSHDTEAQVLTGPDLVPALTAALLATLA